MERFLSEKLIRWKDSTRRKPLLIHGVRHAGKTWLMKEFGRTAYKKTAYVSFISSPQMKGAFDKDCDPRRILMDIAAWTGVNITPSDTLIILDDTEEVPRALESLKYFCQEAPEYHVIAADSFPGPGPYDGISFPVGKVSEMTLYPMSFREFLLAMGERELSELLRDRKYGWLKEQREKYIHWLRNYLYVGGMPETVSLFQEQKDYRAVRSLQMEILGQYEKDFGKHAEGTLLKRIKEVWSSVPAQLSKENRKFFLREIKKGGRMKDFAPAIERLVRSGLLLRVNRVRRPGIPLKSYAEPGAFKLYPADVGLLSAMYGISSKVLTDGNAVFHALNGALAETFVLQELNAMTDCDICYYSNDDSTFEIPFLLEGEDGIVPVEVKAGESPRARGFRNFCEKYRPQLALRTSLSDYREQDRMKSIPLYAIGTI